MPKIITVIRHGEAQHNVDHDMLAKRDTILTKEGRKQAKAVGKYLINHKIDVVLTSPVLRALQTTRHMLTSAESLDQKFRFKPEVVLDLRERVRTNCIG